MTSAISARATRRPSLARGDGSEHAGGAGARGLGPAASLRSLLDGTRTIEGLVVDADARWDLLSGLVAIGEAGPAEIEAETGRDATATGARRAATARALLPTKESKADTWQRAALATWA